MSEKLYKLRSLEWNDFGCETFAAKAGKFHASVEPYDDFGGYMWSVRLWGILTDHGTEPTIDAAKLAAESHCIKLVSEALIEVPSATCD